MENDMTRPAEPPSLYEWAGGTDRLTALFDAFYERVRRDDLLGPLFANMDPEHVAHVAAFVGEVFGGPKAYSSDRGGHAAMVRRHMGRHLTQEHRRRWMSLLLET